MVNVHDARRRNPGQEDLTFHDFCLIIIYTIFRGWSSRYLKGKDMIFVEVGGILLGCFLVWAIIFSIVVSTCKQLGSVSKAQEIEYIMYAPIRALETVEQGLVAAYEGMFVILSYPIRAARSFLHR